MDPQNRPDRPSNLPAVPDTRQPPPGPDPWATGRRRADGPAGTPSWLRRLRPRSPRLAAGLGLAVAALLLLPFLDDPGRWWVPVGLGFGTLVLLYLLRLDRLLLGWAPHVAGVVLVAALVWATSANPWAWGLAVGVGVALAGLLLLPRWQVLAVGVVMLVVSAVGYQFRAGELAQQQAQFDAQAGQELRTVLGVTRPELALVSLDRGVRDDDSDRICRILQDSALDQLRAATGGVDCTDAVARLHGRAAGVGIPPTEPDRNADPIVAPGQTTVVDACPTLWTAVVGRGLGRVQLIRTDAPQQRFQIVEFLPC